MRRIEELDNGAGLYIGSHSWENSRCVDRAGHRINAYVSLSVAAKPEDLNRPGHVFPIRAQPGGILERQGHTEATVDLMRMAGLQPYGVLCELTNVDGTMARLPEICEFARKHDFALVTVDDLVEYRTGISN